MNELTGMSLPLVFAARNKSNEIRRRSSSGGVFYALASWVIESGGIVYGCAFDESLRAVHVRCETIEECERCMGSKYSQSVMGETINLIQKDLDMGRTVLFTGTPCQVDAVRHSCKLRERGALVTVDILCHGVPSPTLFKAHIRFLGFHRGSRVIKYTHRDKRLGWGVHERVFFADGTSQQETALANIWRRLFFGNLMLRPSCYRCPYCKTPRDSDITLADFWGVEKTPAGRDDGLGTSLVIVNTLEGLNAMHNISIVMVQLSLRYALPRNPMLVRPSYHTSDRRKPWALLYAEGYSHMIRGMGYHKTKLGELFTKVATGISSSLFGKA